MHAFVVLVMCIIACIVFFNIYEMHTASKSLKLYNKIDNSNDINTANKYLFCAKNKIRKTPLENYRIGNMYDLVLKNNAEAHNYYLRAINQARDEQDEDALFIRTRLRDRIDTNNIFEIDDANYDFFNLLELHNELMELERTLINMHTDEPNNDGKSLEERIRWVSDNQNVHDRNINDELRKGYDSIKDENKYNFIWEIPEIKDYILNIYANEADEAELPNIEPSIKMLDYIEKNGKQKIMKLNETERDFVGNIFTKIYNEKDMKNRKTIMENFMMNLKESYKNGTPVCITGRTARIMSSFTNMDENNPTLGILKDKPILRNEMLLKAADIRNKIFNEASIEVQNKYNNSVQDKDTEDLELKMKKKIREIINKDYAELIFKDSNFVEGVIKEIEDSL